MEAFKQWALAYVEMGYKVLPVVPRGKLPLIDRALGLTRGKDDALSDPEIVRRVWDKHPQANIGLLAPTDVLILDLDSPTALSALLLLDQVFLKAPKAITGSGGAHVWLRWPSHLPVPSVGAKVVPTLSLDLRGLGKSYVVAPPSIHPSGKAYEWLEPLEPPEALPLFPEKLAAVLTTRSRARASRARPSTPAEEGRGKSLGESEGRARAYALAELKGRCEEMASTPEGSRHSELVRHAVALWGWIRQGALSEHEAFGPLAQAALESGLDEREVRDVLRWVKGTTPERALED